MQSDAICEGFEESVGGGMCQEAVVETWHVVFSIPSFYCWPSEKESAGVLKFDFVSSSVCFLIAYFSL